MARDQEQVTLTREDGWKEFSNAQVSNITFQILKGNVQVRVSDVRPGDDERGFVYHRLEGVENKPLSQMAQNGGARVWGSLFGIDDALILVDHA